MSIADYELLVQTDAESANMTFDEFHADYCRLESDVVAPHRWERVAIAMSKVLFYGQTGDTIIIYRGGVHNGGVIPWIATYDLANKQPVFYDELLFHQTTDTDLASGGAYSTTTEMLLAPKNDWTQTVRFRMGGHVLAWVQNGVATAVEDLGIPVQ